MKPNWIELLAELAPILRDNQMLVLALEDQWHGLASSINSTGGQV